MNREDIITLLNLGYSVKDIAGLYGVKESDVRGYLPEGEAVAKLKHSKEYQLEKMMTKAFQAIDALEDPNPAVMLKACDLLRNIMRDNLVKGDMILNMRLKEKELNTNIVPEQIYIDGMEPSDLERIMEKYKRGGKIDVA